MVVVEVVSMTVDEVHAPFHHGNHKFFKCTPPLKKLLHQTNQEGEMVGLTKQITWEPVDNEHPVLHWCSWCTHILEIQTWSNGIPLRVYCRPLPPSVYRAPKNITRERAGFPPIFSRVTHPVPSVTPSSITFLLVSFHQFVDRVFSFAIVPIVSLTLMVRMFRFQLSQLMP